MSNQRQVFCVVREAPCRYPWDIFFVTEKIEIFATCSIVKSWESSLTSRAVCPFQVFLSAKFAFFHFLEKRSAHYFVGTFFFVENYFTFKCLNKDHFRSLLSKKCPLFLHFFAKALLILAFECNFFRYRTSRMMIFVSLFRNSFNYLLVSSQKRKISDFF